MIALMHCAIIPRPSPPVPMTAALTGPPLIGPRAAAATPSATSAGVPAIAFRKLRRPCSFCSSVRFILDPFSPSTEGQSSLFFRRGATIEPSPAFSRPGEERRNKSLVAAATIEPSPAFSRPGSPRNEFPVAERRLSLARPFQGRGGETKQIPSRGATIEPSPAFSRPGSSTTVESPQQITFVVINAVLLQKFQILFLKTHLAMMFALILNIALHIQDS